MIPYHHIFTGASCDNHCQHCPVKSAENRIELQNLVKQLEGFSDCRNVAFTGGEPLIHEDFFSLVTAARRQGAKRIKVVTNGRKLAEWRVLGRLLEEGCRIFEIKIFGSHPAIHDTVTGIRGSFEETREGLSNLLEASTSQEYEDALFVTARIEITRANLQDLTMAMVLASSLQVDRIVFARQGNDFPMTESARIVGNVIRTATLNRVWSMSQGFPPCVMKGTERHLCELLEPAIYHEEKAGGCATCACRDICQGPPEDYVQQFGADEFKPIARASYLEDVKRIAETRSAYV
jgi:sulfatase maturation enzyme AslB (radical SAM superfamily)